MKTSKTKKRIAALVAAALCLSMSNAAIIAAQPEGDTTIDMHAPRNIAIVATDCYLTLGTLGRLTCFGQTEVQYGYNAGVVVELQQNAGGWGTIKTWSNNNAPWAWVTQDWYVPSGYSYRLKLTHKAYDGNWNQIESIIKYSNTVYY